MTGIATTMRWCIRMAMLGYVLLFSCLLVWWRRSPFDNEGNWKSGIYEINVKHAQMYFTPHMLIARQYSVITEDVTPNRSDPYMKYLEEDRQSLCKGRFIGYKNMFAKLTNVVINPSLCVGKKGGENISSVLNQSESDEFCQLENGFFSLSCKDRLMYTFKLESHLNKWILMTNTTSYYYPYYSVRHDWTIAVVRYEYANLYHTMTDFYNAFLVAKFYQVPTENVCVLWIDGHPFGVLDQTWNYLFGKIIRISELQKPIKFRNFIWGVVGYNSPLNEHTLPEVPYLEEFRDFFLTKHGIHYQDEVNCNKLNILLIWRRDYLAHPRNPSGKISRKIKNEDELMHKLKEKFKDHNVNGLQIDTLSMKQQLKIISKTDILIGMHGAGLSHTMFLPRHAGLIEMFPSYFSPENRHFQSMAKWRHLHYIQWMNNDDSKDIDQELTIVDTKEIAELTEQMHSKICL